MNPEGYVLDLKVIMTDFPLSTNLDDISVSITTMSARAPDPEQVAQQYINGYNERDEAKLVNLFSPMINWEGEKMAREELDHATWWDALPDLQLELDWVISDGSEAAFRFTMTGSHEGEFQDLEPTGETIEVSEIIMIRVGDEGISSLRYEWDELGFFTQLGSLDHPLS